MDKLIKSITKEHMRVLGAKAEVRGISTSAYIRELIRDDSGIVDLVIKDVPYTMAQGIRREAVIAGLSMDAYIFRVLKDAVAT